MSLSREERPNDVIKLLAVFGTRPEAVKMAPLIRLLKEDPRFECRVCVSAQHRELLDAALLEFGIEPDWDLDVMRPAQSMAEVAGRVLRGLEGPIREYRPDMVLVHGDTATGLAAALCAFYCGVPAAHVEAGLRTWNRYSPFPEEMNRQLIGRLAELHFAPTELSRENLIKEGVPEGSIFVTGNTAMDALRLFGGEPPEAPERPFVLVTCHRRENLGRNYREILSAAVSAAEEFPDIDVIYIRHPSPEIAELSKEIKGPVNFRTEEPVSYRRMTELIRSCLFAVTDSGGLQEEVPALGKPVLVVRDSTERPEAVKAGGARLAGTDREEILREMRLLLTDKDAYAAMSGTRTPYGDGHASERMIDALYDYFKTHRKSDI